MAKKYTHTDRKVAKAVKKGGNNAQIQLGDDWVHGAWCDCFIQTEQKRANGDEEVFKSISSKLIDISIVFRLRTEFISQLTHLFGLFCRQVRCKLSGCWIWKQTQMRVYETEQQKKKKLLRKKGQRMERPIETACRHQLIPINTLNTVNNNRSWIKVDWSAVDIVRSVNFECSIFIDAAVRI